MQKMAEIVGGGIIFVLILFHLVYSNQKGIKRNFSVALLFILLSLITSMITSYAARDQRIVHTMFAQRAMYYYLLYFLLHQLKFDPKDMEKVFVSGVAYNKDEARITVRKVPDKPGVASRIFEPVFEARILVDMIIQNTSEDGLTDLTFTVAKSDFYKTMELLRGVAQEIGAEKVLGDEDIAKVSIIGVGMRSHAGVAKKMFGALAKEGINITMISTSEIKISCIIEEKYTELAVRVLHEVFGLDDEEKGG